MEKLKPEKVVEIMEAKGVKVSVEQAAGILAFLRRLSNIIVAQYLEKKKK